MIAQELALVVLDVLPVVRAARALWEKLAGAR